MTILLTHGYYLAEDPREAKIMMPYPPLGMLCLSAFLEKKGIAHEVLDTTFGNPEEWRSQLRSVMPSVAGIYCTHGTRPRVSVMIGTVRELCPSAMVVAGGPDVRHNAQEYLDTGANVLIPGEAEEAFSKLCCFISENPGALPYPVPGLIFPDNGQIVNTGETSPAVMEELPFPARARVDMRKYFKVWERHHGYASVNVNTQRGCPFACNWCSKSVFGNTSRRRPASNVADEIEILQKTLPPHRIWFADDVFTLGNSWITEFTSLLKERSLKISYEIITRADCLSPSVIGMLRQSGCFRVWIGAESGSQSILDAMNRKTDAADVIHKTRLLAESGIETGIFIMLGYPGETIKDIVKTSRFLKQAGPSHFTLTMVYPVRGTQFSECLGTRKKSTLAWEKSTDRDVSFPRTYSPLFYRAATAWLQNTMNAPKSHGLKRFKCNMKKQMAFAAMLLLKCSAGK